MAKKQKTISGAMESIPNISHNRREHIPPNSDTSRLENNYVWRFGNFSLEQIYDKLFQKAYEKWREIQIKKSRGERAPATYYEKILQDKKKKPLYEIIWQIGDMMDTGFMTNPEDAKMAEKLLNSFMLYLFSLPNVYMLTKEDMENPDFEPPFDAGLIIYEIAYHGDENSPHMHMTYIPYVRNVKRGCEVQNSFTKAFAGMGYCTKDAQATDKDGNLVWQTDENGEKVAQKKRISYGGVDWVEEQKSVLQAMMEEKYGWERLYKGSNPRGNLLLSDYRREKAAERAQTAELKRLMEEQKLAEVDKQVSQSKQKKESLEGELNFITDQLTDYKRKIDEKKIVYYGIIGDIDKKEKQRDELDNDVTKLKDLSMEELADVRKLQKLIIEYEAKQELYEQKIKTFAEQADSLLKSIDQATSELQSLKNEILELRQQKNDAVQGERDARNREKEATDKKKEIESQVAELELKVHKLKDLQNLYKANPEDAYYDIREDCIALTVENNRLKEENRGLKEKLQQVYEFMKQFAIGGKNLLEMFLEKTGEAIEKAFKR